jgi:stage II sporulation protein D
VETAATNAAVAATRGQIVTYQGQPVVTYFFSTSGGRTESVENTPLGSEPKPWLVSVEDEYDSVSPRHRWKFKPSLHSVARKLRGLVAGKFRGIRVTRRGVSPRIVTAEIVGSRGTTPVDGATLRARLGLYDTWAYFTTIKTRKAPADRSGGAIGPRSFSFVHRRPAGALTGTVIGAGRRTLKVQVRRDGRWQPAGQTRLGRGGTYRWTAEQHGTYRVVVGGAAGAAVKL